MLPTRVHFCFSVIRLSELRYKVGLASHIVYLVYVIARSLSDVAIHQFFAISTIS